jgi:putative ABC transport system permease protein
VYPELTAPLVATLLAAVGVVAYLVVFRPVLRRLALRQVVRRPTESVLVVLGSVLGTALIVASLTVGDSLDRSVRQSAYDTLGPVDVSVRSPGVEQGDEVARRLAPLRSSLDVDGLVTVRVERAAAVRAAGDRPVAEPRALVWEVDFEAAGRFGQPDPSGLAGPAPGPGEVVINEHLAGALGAGPGDGISLYVYGRPVPVTVARVVPAEGLAGAGLGGTVNHNAFVAPGTLVGLSGAGGTGGTRELDQPTTITYLSNRGGVEDGAARSDRVTAQVRDLLGPRLAATTLVETPKQEVLEEADQTGDQLGAVFLFVASFSIIAGVLLITNIFVMLAEERKGQLGTLRAIGMRRRQVAGSLAVEGALYSGAAALLGAGLGVLLGRVVAVLAGRIVNTFDQGANQLTIVFAVTPTSVVNGTSAGFLIAFAAVVLTSVRIARTNVIAAIRDLPAPRHPTRWRPTALSAVVAGVLAALAVPAVATGEGYLTYLLPALAAVAAIPFLRRFWSSRAVLTGVALAMLGWGMVASLVRPRVFDDASTATYVVIGTMLTFGAVVLISLYQGLVLRPLRPLVRRPSQTGLATRLAVAYPTARHFRTGATLAMYCIVVLVIVMLTQISEVIDSGVETSVDEATGEWSLRADYNPAAAPEDPERAVVTGRFEGSVLAATGLVTAPATGNDPQGRTADPLPVLAVGIAARVADDPPALQERLPGLPEDAAAWRLVADDPSYVLVDSFYGATGGPPGEPVGPGSELTLTDQRTGRQVTRVVAGVVGDGQAFYGIGGGEFRYPVLLSQDAAREQFGDQARPSSLLLRLAPGVTPAEVAPALQAEFLASGLVVTDLAQAVRDNFASTRQFFQLMRGYLALGLLVGITGLGVVMVRAVRERRRTIAVLRALGFRARTVRLSFITESGFVALEGVVVGTLLGVAITWLFHRYSPAFAGLDVPYPIAWGPILLTIGATVLASLLATVGPARRAAQIRPALALRIAD